MNNKMKNRAWLYYAIITTVLWGVWGALIEIPEKAGFPATLGYTVWSLTLIPVAILALKLNGWKLDRDKRSVIMGISAGLMGCGGQLILLQTLRTGPAYLVFPIISLYPVVTIVLSVAFLKERASKRGWSGILLALIAIVLLAYQQQDEGSNRGLLWILLAMSVFLLWGVQAYIMKFAGDSKKEGSMQAESFVFYAMVSSLILIPVALMMTDFSQEINWGFTGVYSAGIIQLLNSVGYLFFAYTIRHGKAIIVVPMLSLAPVLTVILSLILYMIMPHPVIITGMVLAFIAIFLMAE
jgi:drug/metabolite transporter (DMT)-like permease